MAETFKVTGADEIRKKLRGLEAAVAKRHTKTALRAGARIIRDEAKGNAPVRTGLTRSAIGVVTARSKKGSGEIAVLVQLGKKNFVGKAFYGAINNFGHWTGKRTNIMRKVQKAAMTASYTLLSKAAGRKFIEGTHFMEKAFESKKQEAMEASQTRLLELIDQEARK